MTQINPEFEKARKYVKANETLLRMYFGNNAIAVWSGRGVIDCDKDKYALAKRVQEENKIAKLPVRIGTIDDILNPQIREIDSPEVVARS